MSVVTRMQANHANNSRTKRQAKVKALSEEFETASPEEILRWAVEEFGSDMALATGFGAEGCVLVAMLSAITPSARIFYLDTDLLFPETYALRDELEARYGDSV